LFNFGKLKQKIGQFSDSYNPLDKDFQRRVIPQVQREVQQHVVQPTIRFARLNMGQNNPTIQFGNNVAKGVVNTAKTLGSGVINIQKSGNAALTALPKQAMGLGYSVDALGHVITGNQLEAKKSFAKQQAIRNELNRTNKLYKEIYNPAESGGVKFARRDCRGGLQDVGQSLGNVGQLGFDVASTVLPIGQGGTAKTLIGGVGRGTLSGAGFGAAQGGLDTLKNKDYKNAGSNILGGAGGGAVFGGVLGGVGHAISKTIAANGGTLPVGQSIKDVGGKRIVSVDKNQHLFDNARPKDYPKIVKKYMNDNFVGKTISIDDGGNVSFTKLGSGKYARSGTNMGSNAFNAKMRLTPELDNAVKISKLKGVATDTKPSSHGKMSKDGFEYRTFDFEVQGQQYHGVVSLGKNGEIRNFYDVFPIKKTSATGMGGVATRPEKLKADANIDIINPQSNNVKPSKNIQNGRTLAAQNPAQNSNLGIRPLSNKLNQRATGLQLNKLEVNPINNPKLVSQSPSLKTPNNNSIISQVGADVKDVLTGSKVKDKSLNLRLSGNEKYPKQVQDMLKGTYVVKDNTTTIKDAKNLIRLDPNNAEIRALAPKNAVDIQIGSELFNKYSSQGNWDKAVDFVNASDSTNLGQMVQMFSQYDKTTPQGAVRFAQSAINKYNKIHKNSPLEIKTTDIENFVSQAKKIQVMPEGRERNIASQQLMESINKLIPSTFTDKAITVWKAGLLTSPRTTMRNLIGNTVHGITEIAKDPIAALNDIALSKRTGLRTLTPTLKGELSGAKKGWQSAKDIMTTGFDPEQNIAKFDVQKVTWGNNKPEQALKKYTDFVFNMMGAQDKPFYHAALNRSLYDQAGAAAINAGKHGDKAFIESLVSNPTAEMLKNATQDASIATFKDRNALGKMASSFKNGMKGSQLGEAASEIVAPFTGVPSSIAGQIINYSPIGLAKGLTKDVKVLAKNMPELQRQASQEIGRGVIGTGIMGIAAVLTAKGLMTGQPKDAAESRQWQLEGKQANSVLVGGKWRSINSIGPEMLVALAGSKFAQNKPISETAASIGKDFLSQTFLQGVQGPLNAISDPSRFAQSYVSQQLSSMVPNFVKDTAKAFDKTQRETTANDMPTAINNAVKSGIPGLRNTLLPKRDALGNPMPQEPTGFNAYIDLFNSKTPIKSSVIDELSRLNGTDNNATPSAPSKTQTVNGQKIKIEPTVMDKFETRIGEIAKPQLETLVASQEYSTLTDEDKAKAIDKVMQGARARAKIDVLGETQKTSSSKTKLGTLKLKKPKSSKTKIAKVKKYTPKTPKIKIGSSSLKSVKLKNKKLKVAALKVAKG